MWASYASAACRTLAVLGILIGACQGFVRPPVSSEGLAPGHCRVLAQVEELRSGGTQRGLEVILRLERVLGYGAAFPAPLPRHASLLLFWSDTLPRPRVGERWELELEAVQDGLLERGTGSYRMRKARRR